MPHYQRYILVDERKLSLPVLLEGLREADPAWSLEGLKPGPPETAELRYAGERYALLELNLPGEDVCKDELRELEEIAENSPGPKQAVVLHAIEKARALIAAEVVWADREREETLLVLDRVWAWLLSHRRGLVHEDGEGFSDSTGLILAIR